MKYLNFKIKDKKLVLEFNPSLFKDLMKNKIFITIVILIVVSLSLFYSFRAYYYTHWYVVYYGKSENFEAEVVAVPAIIEKKALKVMKEWGALTRMYHKELWIKCDKADEIKICDIHIKSNEEGEGFGGVSSEVDSRTLCRTLPRLFKRFKDTNWFLIGKFWGTLTDYRDYKVSIKIVKEGGEVEEIEIKYLTKFPFISKAPFLPPCEKVIFDPYSKDFIYTP